jgi:hypothetical protein
MGLLNERVREWWLSLVAVATSPLTQRQVWWYSLVSVVVTVILVSAMGVVYTRTQIDKSEKKLCRLIILSDEMYKEPGVPMTPTRQKLAAANHQLRTDLGCDG